MEKYDIKQGDVLQINPDHPKFPGFLVVCDEPKVFGCQGYLLSQFNFEATRFQGVAYVRVKFEEVEYVGKIQWHWKPMPMEGESD